MSTLVRAEPNFQDGRIEEVITTSSDIRMKISCAEVEGGELFVDICPHPGGKIYLHFSGLGGKKIGTDQQSANGLYICVKD